MDHKHSKYSFEPNAILRGAQLSFVGAYRALQNPKLFTNEHYRQVFYAVLLGVLIRLILAIPNLGVRIATSILGLFVDLQDSTWHDELINDIEFIKHSVLQVPFFLMTFIRVLSPAMDQVFMANLDWADKTYLQKHQNEDPQKLRAMYYPNLKMYVTKGHGRDEPTAGWKRTPQDAIIAFSQRYGRRAATSLAVYLLSFVPRVGRFVLPAVSFYTFHSAVGVETAAVVFATGIFLPKRYLVMFLQSYFSSKSLMRELLEPYLSRIHYRKEEKQIWFHDRAGVLYGFAFAFFLLLKVPLLGVLVYGIAEA